MTKSRRGLRLLTLRKPVQVQRIVTSFLFNNIPVT
jgi:hypothetical protein